MKSINATLLANQKLPNGRGFALATLADNGRLHPTAIGGSGSSTGGSTIGCECGTFYVRLRFTASDLNKIEVQKITDPTVSAQWTTWAALVASNVAGALTIALFWTGTYAVMCYQELSTGDVKYRRSTDGVTWSTAANVRTPLVAAATWPA